MEVSHERRDVFPYLKESPTLLRWKLRARPIEIVGALVAVSIARAPYLALEAGGALQVELALSGDGVEEILR